MKRSVALGWITADVISTFGDQLYKFSLPWTVLAATRSTWDLSLVSTVQQGALLIFGLAIGVIMDRPRRLQWMMLALVGEAVGVGIVSYVPMTDVIALSGLYAIIFSVATLSQVYKTGVRAVLPLVVQEGQLEQANGVIQTARTAMQMVGPIVAGWLILRFHHAPFLIDGLTFTVLAIILITMRSTLAPRLPTASPSHSLWLEVREGIRYLRSDRILFWFATVMALTNLGLTGALAMVVYPIQRDFHLHSSAGGVIFAGAALASMLGSIMTAQVVKWLGTVNALVGALCLLGLGMLGMALPIFWCFFLGYALTLSSASLFNVAILSLQQRRTPAPLRGRVTSTSLVMSRLTAPIGALLTGLIGTTYSVEVALFVDAGIVCLTAILALWNVHRVKSSWTDVAAH